MNDQIPLQLLFALQQAETIIVNFQLSSYNKKKMFDEGGMDDEKTLFSNFFGDAVVASCDDAGICCWSEGYA